MIAATAPMIAEESTGSLSFVDAPRCGLGIFTGTILDAEFIQEPTPRGMKKRLYPHQRTILHAMVALEQRGYLESKNSDRVARVHTRMGILAEKLGSGKTIMILALILASPPPNRPIVHSSAQADGSRIIVEARFPATHIIRSTFVFVAAAVVRQWEEAVAAFTTLRVFTISDLRGLRKFAAAPTTTAADIIIVKNGLVSYGTADIATYAGATPRRIHTIVAAITRRYCFERVVYDDFDTVPLPVAAAKLNGLFTWFVSATCLKSRSFGAVNTPAAATIDQPLIHPTYVVKNLPLFVICNADAFVEESTRLGRPLFIAHSVKNDSGRMIGAMAAIAGEELIEMLSAGAIGTAAEKYGIAGGSVADVFRAVLRENYESYTLTAKCIAWATTAGPADAPPTGGKHSHALQNMFLNPPTPAAAAALLAVMRGEIKVLSKNIERVKSSIADGDCPVCSCPLADDAVIILRCCGKILCQECATQSTNFTRDGDGVTGGMVGVTGKCPNCRAEISFNDLIFVGEEIKLDDIAHGRGAAEPPTRPERKAARTKTETLIEILRGETTADQAEIEMDSYGVIGGAEQLPEPAPSERKYLIFTKHMESLGDAQDAMAAAGIAFEQIHGTIDQIAATVARFRGGDLNVLLVDGERFSSGLNLQCATDLIFMLRMIDRAAAAQIIGRIQRIGRTCRATVHYIQYEHERN